MLSSVLSLPGPSMAWANCFALHGSYIVFCLFFFTALGGLFEKGRLLCLDAVCLSTRPVHQTYLDFRVCSSVQLD